MGKSKKKASGRPPPSKECSCRGCGSVFESKNALFRHLKLVGEKCIVKEELDDFNKYVVNVRKRSKVILLYGYLPFSSIVSNGSEAAELLLEAVEKVQRETFDIPHEIDEDVHSKLTRSYGHTSRAQDIVAQDDGTGAISEVLATRLYPLPAGCTVEMWLDQVQSLLDKQIEMKFADTTSKPWFSPIRILGRQDLPNACTKFNAEIDVTHRRVEYILPVGLIVNSDLDYSNFVQSMPSFEENHRHTKNRNKDIARPASEIRRYLHSLKKTMQRIATQVEPLDMEDKGAVMEKEFHIRRLKRQKGRHNNSNDRKETGTQSKEGNEEQSNTIKSKSETTVGEASIKIKTHKVLKRKRFHNFTAKVMAHDYLAYRRLDRIYHRATLRFPNECENSNFGVTEETSNSTPFMVMSLTGDLFLTGQVCRVVGLIVAIAKGIVDPDLIDCVFDEDYPHLIPIPPAPTHGMVASAAFYSSWEGKMKSILSARVCDRYDQGWNQETTLRRLEEWKTLVYREIARRWLQMGTDKETGQQLVSQKWLNEFLLPWAVRAKAQLEDYRIWLKSRKRGNVAAMEDKNKQGESIESDGDGARLTTPVISPPLESVDASVPKAFQRVLQLLREADASGLWPATSLKRQLVMISTQEGVGEGNEIKPDSLVLARVKAKGNKEERFSAYSYVEGQGGASGSFSVGSMPDDRNKQPKGNALFPELVKAAFELELALCPGREPSSTIAINRNAQFRPHTDNGAGAGQSTSLIVGLGTYTGGELMVEGNKHDIRYKPLEFNGWLQRHWTMPFCGERYSLVWFTPKGCEGLRGIDLDLGVK